MKKYIRDLKVIKIKHLNAHHFILVLHSSEKLPEILPGQFVEVSVKNSQTTFLRRPFSIHDVNVNEQTISLFIKKVGVGTLELANSKEGETLNLIFPLGKGFTISAEEDVLLIGGGCGVAPLLYLAKYLNKTQIKPSILIGGRSKDDIHELDEYKKYGTVYISTDDGTLGESGLVIDHSVLKNKFSKIYSCGPLPMMKAVSKLAKEKNIDCEVSLENTMACGIGACLCCVTETVQGNKCVCTEGPVFNTNELAW